MAKKCGTRARFQDFRWLRDPGEGASSAIDRPSAGPNRRFVDQVTGKLLFFVALFAIVTVLFIIVFLLRDGYQVFFEVGIWNFLAGQDWNPAGRHPAYGVLPLITGTVLVTALAMVIAVPLSIGSAIFIAEIAGPRIKTVVKPAIELLAGIPSVVYGFFGLILLTDWIRIAFDQPSGSSWLAGSILLAIMAIPTITSVAEDAISSVPREFREGSLALGANHWQTIKNVIVPGALSGISAAVILGMGRAIGETMAVLMVTGNAAVIPDPIFDVFSPVRTLTGTLGIEMGEVAFGSLHYHALFGVAVVLLLITLAVNSAARVVVSRIQGTQGVTWAAPCRTPETSVRGMKGALRRSSLYRAFTAALSRTTPLTRRPQTRIFHPKTAQRCAFFLVSLSVAIVLVVLGVILVEIVVNGAGALTWEFLTGSPKDLGRAGGIFPAIAGTLCLVGGALAVALPLGIATAVYLIEYTAETPLTRGIRAAVDLLNGTPSIVFGLCGFAFLVLFLNLGVSMIAGQITLGLMILPTIIRTTEESLRSIPHSLREGSYALGATKWQTIRRVVLPPAIPGILTGAILSIGRAAGETAPIMFTATVCSSKFLPSSLTEPVMALPYHLFILTTSVPGASTQKFGTALVLLLMVLSIYLVAILVRRRYHRTTVM